MASSKRPRRAMILLYICLILLTVSWNTLAQLQGEEMDRCVAALRQADADDDLKIDEDEHLEFLRHFGSDGFLADVEERPLALRSKFYALACMCHERGGNDECCIGDHAVIDISGTRDGASQEDQDYIKTVCTLTKRTIDLVENLTTVAPFKQGGITSVWLSTTYQVAILGAGDFLSDLTDAMNTLIPEVLQEVTQERRQLQQVESLPTYLNSTPTDCPEGLPETDTCEEIRSTTYVVGPEDDLNQTVLEEALTEAIMEGRLQSLLEEDTPIRVLDLAALEEVNEPTEAPIIPQEEGTDISPTVSPADTGNVDSEQDGWNAGAIAGVALAAFVAVGLAVGLGLRRRSKKASAESFKSQESHQKESGSIANAFEFSDDGDTYLDLMERGDAQQTISSSDADNKVGLENFDEENVELLPPVSMPSTFVTMLTLRNSRQASDGDMGASDNHIDSLTSLPLTNSFEAIDSHGNSMGSLTPVGYGTAMGLPEDTDSDSPSSSSSSSSSGSGSDSELTYDDSMSESSPSSSSSEEDYLPFEREVRPPTSPVYKSGQTLDSMSACHSDDNLVLDNSAKSGLGVASVAITPVVHSSLNVQDVPSEPSSANGIPIVLNDGPSAGAIAVATMGAVGVVAAGGAVVYAATNGQGDDKGETEEEMNPHVTEISCKPQPELQAGDGLNEAVAMGVAGVGAASVFLAGAESFSTVEDPVAVGEESLMTLDYGLDGTSAVGAASFAAIHDPTAVDESESEDENQSECGSEYSSVIRDEEENENAGESLASSRSDLAASQTRYEATSVLGQPPLEPSPAEEGLSTGAAAVIGAASRSAFARVGAVAAFLASRRHIEDDTRSENDTSRESGDVSNDSQCGAGSRGANVPPAYERPRQLSSGKDHQYYAAAATMTTGAVAAALYEANEASDDGEESEHESEGSDEDNASEGELVQQSSSDQASLRADEGNDDGVPFIAVSQAKDPPEELYNESQEDLKADDKEDFDISSIQTNDAEAKGITAESEVSSTNKDVSSVAAELGAEALAAMALTSAAPQANDSIENKRPDAKDSARQCGDSSSESGSDFARDESSVGQATNVTTLGMIKGSTLAGSASLGDRGTDTTTTIGVSTRLTSEKLLGSFIKDRSSPTGAHPHSATTIAAALDDPCSTKKSVSSSSQALGSPTSSNTVTSDCAPKAGIIAGVAAGGAALGAAVVYTLARSTKDNGESESASEYEQTTDDEEESSDEESADSATIMPFSSSRSISKATTETGYTGRSLQGDSSVGFFKCESDPPISEQDLAAGVSGVEGMVATTYAVAKPPQDAKAPENVSDKRLIHDLDESSASGESLEEEVAAVPIVNSAPMRLAPISRESAMQPEDSSDYESESDEGSAPVEAPKAETVAPIVGTPALCATLPDRDFLIRSEESTDYESESNESGESGESPEEDEVVLPLVDTPPLLVPTAIGAEALAAMALASAAPQADDSIENKRPDEKDFAHQSGDSSSESGSDFARDESSVGQATNVATLGMIKGSTLAGSASMGDRGTDTTTTIGVSTRLTSEKLLGSFIKDRSSPTGAHPHSATTIAAALDDPCSTKKSVSSSSQALGSPTSSNTVTSDCAPKAGIIAGVAAGGAALGAAVVYTLARSTKDNGESESASEYEQTTDDEEESSDEESADSATIMPFSSSRSISKATTETGEFLNCESDPPISEQDLAADVSGVEGMVATTYAVAKPPQDAKAPENVSDKRLIHDLDESSASGESLEEEAAAVPIVNSAPIRLAPISRESAMQPDDSSDYESESDEGSAPVEAPKAETVAPIVGTPALCATPPDRDFLIRSEESTDYESESNESGDSGEAPEEDEVVLPLVDTPPLLVPRATSMRSEESTNYETGSEERRAPGEALEEKNVTPAVDTTPLRAAPISRKSSMRSQGYRSSRSSGLTSSGDDFVAIEENTAVNSVDTARLRSSFTNRESSMRSQGYQSSTTSTFTESGDTFVDMEEAAHSATPGDVIVLKSRFGVSQAVVASSHESKSNESDGSVVQEGYSDGSSSGSTSYSGSDSNSESDSDSSSGSSYESDSNDSSDDSTTDSSKDEYESSANLKTQDVVPHNGIPPKVYTSGAQYLVGGSGNRAALLRARSDAALPVSPRDESVAAMLATWDEGYDIREGDEDDAQEYESLLGVTARDGLIPIEETDLSDASSQGMSVRVEDPTAVQDDSSAVIQYDSSVPILYGSSALLDFDYSLRTILEQSGEVSYDEPSESSPGGDIVTMRNGLDSISERFEGCGSVSSTDEQPVKQRVTEVQDGSSGLLSSEYSGEHSLDAISEPSHKMFKRDSSDASSNGMESLSEEGGTGERSAEEGSSVFLSSGSINQSTEQETTLRSREKIEDESSEDDSSSDGSSSDYSTESGSTSEESEASSSSTSSTSCTPIPSAPISSPPADSCLVALQGPDDSLDRKISMSNEEHDASDAWVAISRANKTNLPSEVKGSANVAEWAVERSLSGLRAASAASSLSCESSHNSRDDASNSSEDTVDV